jgi:hypothetical protein
MSITIKAADIEWTPLDRPTAVEFLSFLSPGTLLKLDDGGVLIVGHVNDQAGVCDDCCCTHLVVAYARMLVEGMVEEWLG